jgi:hypothetical protein
MVYSVLLVFVVGFVVLLAVLGALILIGLAVYGSRNNQMWNTPSAANQLTPDQAVEITSTWNILNH